MPEIPVSEFGSRLKQARVARGVSLAQIASVTKISVRSLEAVERNDFSRLPGGIFTRSFVRAYASEVGLDPEVTLKQFLAQCPEDVAAVPTDAPESIDGPSGRAEWQEKLSWRHLAIALAVAALAIAAWVAYSRQPRPQAASTVAEPSLVTAPATTPPPSAPVGTSPAAVPSSMGQPPGGVPAGSAAPVAPSAPLSLEIVAMSDCWLFYSVDGKAATSRVYTKGERVTVSASRELVLKAGDAGALAITINGRRARPLGTAGKVVTVRLTPENWTSFVD